MERRRDITRRRFLGAGAAALAAAPVLAKAQMPGGTRSLPRAEESFALRERAARRELHAAATAQQDNGDEARYASHIGSYSKGLPHNQLGEVDRAAYDAYRRALLALPDTGAFGRVPLGGSEKLVNPMAGVAFDLEGIDIQKLAAPSAPALASPERAAEMVELYWMALCREIPFIEYADHPLAHAAAGELSRLPGYEGVTPATLFRGALRGDLAGPQASQLFVTPFAYGQYRLDGRITTFPAGADYLAAPAAWLACRNGEGPFPAPALDPEPRYLRCGRDLAAYVRAQRSGL